MGKLPWHSAQSAAALTVRGDLKISARAIGGVAETETATEAEAEAATETATETGFGLDQGPQLPRAARGHLPSQECRRGARRHVPPAARQEIPQLHLPSLRQV